MGYSYFSYYCDGNAEVIRLHQRRKETWKIISKVKLKIKKATSIEWLFFIKIDNLLSLKNHAYNNIILLHFIDYIEAFYDLAEDSVLSIKMGKCC